MFFKIIGKFNLGKLLLPISQWVRGLSTVSTAKQYTFARIRILAVPVFAVGTVVAIQISTYVIDHVGEVV